MKEELQDFAIESRAGFVRRVQAQKFESFDAFPLSSAYKQNKVRKGLDERVMIRTGHYLKQVRIFLFARGAG